MKKILAAVLLVAASPAFAQSERPAPLPVDRVILSTAGLAHIEHSLDVDGDQDVAVPLRFDQVDDVMKSLVVFDAKGRIGGVTLPGRQPLAEAFRDLPFAESDLQDPILLLNAYQGAGVTVVTGGTEIKGKLIRVTSENIVHDNDSAETRYRLTLMGDDGMRRLWLDEAQTLRFDDAAIKDEITRALAAIRDNATQDQRVLNLSLRGTGKRAVRLGYVVDAPLWKAAYRLVLPAGDGKAGFLQGWSVIENATASDWKNVDLTLVSGNPVTFRQQLYQSYYVSRPEVPVEVLGRVMPRMDEGATSAAPKAKMAAARAKGGAVPPMPAAAPMAFMAESNMAMDGMVLAQEASAPQMGGAGMDDMAATANAAASAEATTQVRFHFGDRVDLAAGQSMLMPFLSGNLPMTKLSLYQPDTHPRHPLAAVEVANEGKSGLPSGILTIYEENEGGGTAFVGDARLPMLGAGEKRLVSYAVDSKTIVDRETRSDSSEGAVSIGAGVLKTAVKVRETTEYTVKAPAGEARTVIIEHPRRGDFKLVAPKAEDAEATEGYYRLRLSLKAGEEKTLPVTLERTVWQSAAILDMPVDRLLAYAGGRGELDRATRALFKDLAALKREADAVDAKIARLAQERENIFADQGRVRENLQSLSGTSDIQQRYLKKLGEQETRIAALDEELTALRTERAAKTEALKKRLAETQEQQED